MPSDMPQPAFVLVRPQMGENIGAAARAMWNFGLDRMRLVAPRDGWPNPRAVAMSSGAGRLLDEAGLYDDVGGAVRDCSFVFATTARQRGILVSNTPGVVTEDTADMTMALILAVPRRLTEGASVLTGEGEPGALKIDNPPAPILMVGLQGGGKTTTTAKIAKRLKEREGKRVLMASLDTNRPAAMEQLAILGQQIGVDTLPIVKGEDPVAIAKRAKTQAGLGGYDVYMLDTAGRLSIDEELMAQVEAVRDVANPRETLLVVDGLTGQDAVVFRKG